jgi:hypothetical protein
LCEVNITLAQMYFRGRGVKENWYIAYYFWLEGLSLAVDPGWGGCRRNSFTDRAYYAMANECKAVADRRLERLGPQEITRPI